MDPAQIEHLTKYMATRQDIVNRLREGSDWYYAVHPGHNGVSPQALVLAEGRRWANPATEHVVCGPMGECFKNAAEAVLYSDTDRIYVEGYALGTDALFLIHHAWLVDPDGNVIDPTWGLRPDASYYGIAFRTDYLRKRILVQEHWGMFDQGRGDDPLLRLQVVDPSVPGYRHDIHERLGSIVEQ